MNNYLPAHLSLNIHENGACPALMPDKRMVADMNGDGENLALSLALGFPSQ